MKLLNKNQTTYSSKKDKNLPTSFAMIVNIRNYKENDDKTHYNSGISTIDKVLNHLENKKY